MRTVGDRPNVKEASKVGSTDPFYKNTRSSAETADEWLEHGLAALLEFDLPLAETYFRQVLLSAADSKDSLVRARAYQGLGDVAAVRRETSEARYYFQKSRTQFLHAKAHHALNGLAVRLEQLGLERNAAEQR